MPAKASSKKSKVADGQNEKEKMRTSEEVLHRLRWDPEWSAQELTLGYEDRLEGPMEMPVAAFVPLSDGGCIPYHRIWYFRSDDTVLWDRRRRLDRVFNSGETAAILAVKPPTGFNRIADESAASETALCIEQAKETMQRLQEERAEAIERKQREKLRKAASKAKAAIADLSDPVQITAVGEGAPPCTSSSQGLRIVTWNVLFDEHIDDPELLSRVRAPEIARELCAAAPDIVALQEVTPDVLDALHADWPLPFWSVQLESDLAIVSRHVITRALSVALGPTKRALIVELAVPGRRIAMANLHLTSDRRGDEAVDNTERRAGQARTVRRALAALAKPEDIVVCGDFNEPNRDGCEAGAACMDGLADAWLTVHGDGDAGCTFDPIQNRLADLQSLVKVPRRLDRIFVGPSWRPHQASLLGLSGTASDHYGVVVELEAQSPLHSSPVFTSSAVLIPPPSFWPQINEIRKQYDPAFGRWMPHINLIYGFLAEEHFGAAAEAMERVLRQHGPIEVCLDKIILFEHRKSASLVVVPSGDADALQKLQAELVALFPRCLEKAQFEFSPHLTLGKFKSAEEAHSVRVEIEANWVPVTLVVDEVQLIARGDDRPFSVSMRLPLGSALADEDALVLQQLEARTGARALPVGSAAMLGSKRPAESDFDVLLVGTQPREAAFQALETLDVSWSRRAEGRFPILQLQMGDVQVDIQYAQSASAAHPAHWSSAACEGGGTAASALRDALALRGAILRARGLRGWQQYQQALLLVKRWAKLRGIHSNALGYLGGFSWALMLANTTLAEQTPPEDAHALAAAMWQRFAAWEWSKRAVTLRASDHDLQVPSDAFMFIPCPSEPSANSARNVTRATLALLQSELQFAASGFGFGAQPAAPELLAIFPLFVCCEVRADAAPEHEPLCSAWLEARLLVLIRKLDDVAARPLRMSPSCWLIGVAGDAAQHGTATLVRSASEFSTVTGETAVEVPAVVNEACQDFRRLVGRGEWQGRIEVTVLDAADARRRVPGAEGEDAAAAGAGR